MAGKGLKAIIIFTVVLTLYTCIDPYTPDLKGYQPLLVVEGMVTDNFTSNTIRLTRTHQIENEVAPTVSDAEVSLTDDAGGTFLFNNKGNGIYKSDSTEFIGVVGRTYTLHILTHDGNNYESDPYMMLPVTAIDSVYYIKDEEFVNNGTETDEGIRIFVDSEMGDERTYLRWDFEETWKFKVPLASKYTYIHDDSIVPLADIKDFCWKIRKSDGVMIHSIMPGESGKMIKNPIYFIASDKSERLMIQYSILVNQYSISQSEYDFWNKLNKVNINGGDIFAAQPYSVISNIHNVNNSSERVLGYFSISAVRQKRLNIPFSRITAMNLPFYHYPCERIERDPSDYMKGCGFCIPPTWDEIYKMWCDYVSGFSFVEPLYKQGTTTLQELVFTATECADCEFSGTRKKPDFWIDME